MALVVGTNCGFVTSAPVDDPNAIPVTMDTRAWSLIDTSPATATKITEIGWWCDVATEESNFEVGLYSDGAAGEPELRQQVSATNAKGTTAGWKKVTVDWSISSSTVYWLAVQLDNTATTSRIDYNTTAGPGNAFKISQTSLLSDWGTSDGTDSDGNLAIYAVWEAGATSPATTHCINVNDTWKDLTEMWVNVDDAWRKVNEAWINVNDTWRKTS